MDREIILILFSLIFISCGEKKTNSTKLALAKSHSHKITIFTLDQTKIEVQIVSDEEKQKLINDLNGKVDNSLRKQWTARTYVLSDQRLLVEFYDRKATLIKNLTEFNKLKEVRFTKNYIDFLKKNISYKIETTYNIGKELAKNSKRLTNFKSDNPDYYDFEVYEMPTRQILFIYKHEKDKYAIVYENIKGLSSDNNNVLEQYYQGMDEWSEKLVAGDPLFDFEINSHLVDPHDQKRLISNHKLSPIEYKVYVSEFYGNLYESKNGYYVLIDEVNQKNGAGNKMSILNVRVYETLDSVRADQKRYEQLKNEKVTRIHFYSDISNKYGKNFPNKVDSLIKALPILLNFDKEQLTFDSLETDIIDEAIKWNYKECTYWNTFFESWFPSVLAYYGQTWITLKEEGKWVSIYDEKEKVWIPQVILKDGSFAFNSNEFYKSLSEWPIPIRLAGNWN